jgi:hypothetical protein
MLFKVENHRCNFLLREPCFYSASFKLLLLATVFQTANTTTILSTDKSLVSPDKYAYIAPDTLSEVTFGGDGIVKIYSGPAPSSENPAEAAKRGLHKRVIECRNSTSSTNPPRTPPRLTTATVFGRSPAPTWVFDYSKQLCVLDHVFDRNVLLRLAGKQFLQR